VNDSMGFQKLLCYVCVPLYVADDSLVRYCCSFIPS